MSPTPPALPPARHQGRYAVALVCLGNICRSPVADVVLASRLDDAGLGDVVSVVSAGTGGWHVGDPMDHRASATLTSAGYDPTRHRAQQFTDSWWPEVDLVLAMDQDNLDNLQNLDNQRATGGPVEDPVRLRLFRDLDPFSPGADVPDPYHGGPAGFEEVLEMVERTAEALVAALSDQRPWEGGGTS